MHSNATRPPRKGWLSVQAPPAPPPPRRLPLAAPPSRERILNELRLEEMEKAPVLRKHRLAHPLAEALARLPAALADLHAALAEPVVRAWAYTECTPREICFEGVRGIPILDRYTTTPDQTERAGSFGGFRVYLLAIGEYILVDRTGQWDVDPPELGHWVADFRAASSLEIFHAAGGEDGARALFAELGARLQRHAARRPDDDSARPAERVAAWAVRLSAGHAATL